MAKRLKIIGLTGGIGMGKTTASQILKSMGFPVYHADKAVHALLGKNGAGVAPVARLFPTAFRRGAIDRKALSRIVFQDPASLKKLEAILHPKVRAAEKIFLKKARDRGASAAILEIPLLFETGGEARCDSTLCVSAPAGIQKARVLARPGMTEEKWRAIRARQMKDREKREKANYVIQTGRGLDVTRRSIEKAVAEILES